MMRLLTGLGMALLLASYAGASNLTEAEAAIRKNDGAKLKALLAKDSTLLTVKTAGGRSLLHTAASLDKDACVKALLDKKMSPNLKDAFGSTPLHLATGSKSVVLLVKAGANVSARNDTGFTPLHEVAGLPTDEPLKALLGARASVTATSLSGSTALHVAAAAGSLDCVVALLKAKADPNAKDSKGRSPLHVARTYPVVETLLNGGASPSLKDRYGQTPDVALRLVDEIDAANLVRMRRTGAG